MAAAENVASYQWVVFTSRNGVTRFFDALATTGGDARRFGTAKVIAIGPATAAALKERGVVADAVPDEYIGEAVGARILEAHGGRVDGVRILLPRALVARDTLPELLRSKGATVDVVAAYETLGPSDADAARLRELVATGGIDIVTFTSSSTVHNVAAALGPDAATQLAKVTVASIGPISSATAATLGIRVDVTAAEYTNEGLVRALAAHGKTR